MLHCNRWIYFILLINIIEPIYSLTPACPSGSYPNNLIPVLIWTKYSNQTIKIYHIGSNELKQENLTNSSSDEIFLNSGIPTACPKHCTFKLFTDIRFIDGVVLHEDNKERTPLSPEYVDINGPKELFCARSFGDCGAKAPIYRYKNRNQLINRYAYSFRAYELIKGYIREFDPICYGWKDSNDNEITGDKDSTDCSPIQNVSNGQVIYKLSEALENSETITMGSFATISCNEGYKRSMQNQVVCVTGTWYPTDKLGECIPIFTEISKSCSPLPPHENGYILYSEHGNNSFPSGTSAYLICADHYYSTFNRQAQCHHGKWSILKVGTCQPISNTTCPSLTAVQNGKIKYLMGSETNITIGTIAELECYDGYVVNGSDVLICELQGWSPVSFLGSCQKDIKRNDQKEKRQCFFQKRPCFTGHPIISNGQLTYSNEPNSFGAYPSETVAVIRCNTGYTIYGALLSTCEDSIWKPPNLGVCILPSAIASVPPRNPCLFGLISPLGGIIVYSKGGALGPFPSGTLATLECAHGISYGPSLSACDNGSWIPPEIGLCSLPYFENSSGSVLELASCLNDYPAPENGIVVYSNNAIRPYPTLTRANIRCNSGYIPIGSMIAICQNGIWYPPIPTQCIQFDRTFAKRLNNAILSAALVSPPPGVTVVGSCVTDITPPTNGYISYSNGSSKRPFSPGTVATINCDHGFKPVGTTSLTCLNGIWSPLVLGQCVDNRSRLFGVPLASTISVAKIGQCPALPTPINGRISYSNGSEVGLFPTGTTATVICNPNYVPLGLSSAVCINGVFTPLLLVQCVPEPGNVESLLKVEELPCAPIPKQLNGDVTYSDITATVYASRTTANLICNLGFVPVGPVETTCKNGQWQPVLGFCQQGIIGSEIRQIPISKQCLFELPAIANGQIRYSTGNILPPYESGTTATLICNSGSTPIGRKLSICIRGSWNPVMLGQCPVNDNSKNLLITGLKQAALLLFDCPASPPVSNGKVYYSKMNKNNKYAINIVANLICDDGYQVLGRSTSYCQGGIWSPWPGVGSCQPSAPEQQQYTVNRVKPVDACSEITIAFGNGMIIYESNDNMKWYNNGASAKLQCNTGYEINGKQVTYCRNGLWLPSIGNCQHGVGIKTDVSCEPINSPLNGKVYYIYTDYIKDYQMGTKAILNCNKGYRAQGETILICNENVWKPNDGFGICIPAGDSSATTRNNSNYL
ncbi:unnamed protein product [Cercopithifilaria johnstoni]|uniref:Sushi domain-containing protein n=1 Tax=Cercopithifilaria johnstoni TaxID=2874296 RepID=A0A8J2Q005_9BILA|nr:unnamed protein product [Cercopithifilaria johnstoni]